MERLRQKAQNLKLEAQAVRTSAEMFLDGVREKATSKKGAAIGLAALEVFALGTPAIAAEATAEQAQSIGEWQPPQKAPPFNDVHPGDHYFPAIEFLRNQVIVQGDLNGNYRPKDNFKRAHMAKMFDLLVYGHGDWQGENLFTDVDDVFKEYITMAQEAGFMYGVTVRQFKPYENMKIAQATTVISRIGLKRGWLQDVQSYKDYGLIDEHNKNLAVASANGLLQGIPEANTWLNKKGSAWGDITREQAAQLMYNLAHKGFFPEPGHFMPNFKEADWIEEGNVWKMLNPVGGVIPFPAEEFSAGFAPDSRLIINKDYGFLWGDPNSWDTQFNSGVGRVVAQNTFVDLGNDMKELYVKQGEIVVIRGEKIVIPDAGKLEARPGEIAEIAIMNTHPLTLSFNEDGLGPILLTNGASVTVETNNWQDPEQAKRALEYTTRFFAGKIGNDFPANHNVNAFAVLHKPNFTFEARGQGTVKVNP